MNEEIFTAITKGKRKLVDELVNQAMADGADVKILLNETMIPALREVGDRFSRNEVFVPEMLIAARAMQAGLDLIEPKLAAAGHKSRGQVAVGTVSGDLHDIGKNLVCMMIKGAGFDVEDLGVDCSVEKFEEAANKGINIICMSALLTTTMPYMKVVTDHFADRPEVKIIIGGAPVTREYCDEIGADAFGLDAKDAVTAVESCLA